MRVRRHNPNSSVKPLADRLCPLLSKPVTGEDEQAIHYIAEIVSAGSNRRHELRDALLSIKARFIESKKWDRALEEIASDLGRSSRTLYRESSAANGSDCEKEEDAQSGAASRPDEGLDEITASSVGIASARVGRLLQFHGRAETADEYKARSIREARKHYPPGKKGPHACAAGYLLAQAASLGITAADLSKMLSTH